MSITVKINLKGFDVLNPLVNKGIANGLDKVRFMIERDAKIFAPRATGLLKASIGSSRKNLIVSIQDSVEYGVYQELGTRFMSAQPFMLPSLNKNIPNIARTISSEIKRLVK